MKLLRSFLVGMLVFVGIAHAQTPGQNSGGIYPFGYYQTYSASIANLASAASATDIFCIKGSSTRVIVLKAVWISGSATGAGGVDLRIQKHSTANTGGTATNPAAIPHDSLGAAATATINAYTANPTQGNVVGSISNFHKFFPPTASGTLDSVLEVRYGNDGMQGILVRGTSEEVCVNLLGVTVTGGAFHIGIDWIEQ